MQTEQKQPTCFDKVVKCSTEVVCRAMECHRDNRDNIIYFFFNVIMYRHLLIKFCAIWRHIPSLTHASRDIVISQSTITQTFSLHLVHMNLLEL